MIEDEFINVVGRYNSDAGETTKLWREIQSSYSEASRHYHTLEHIENLLNELLPVRTAFTEWPVVVFAIVYHDIIYKASKNNNEEKSAELAVKRLKSISVPIELIGRCNDFILATKRHEPVDEEIDLFTDADLSILGSEPHVYHSYTTQVRSEYSIYPDLLYKPGRRKVLQHFLGMEKIYKSEYFRDKYEVAARRNLTWELNR